MSEHARTPEMELIEFVRGKSAPCPRCGYDLRDIPTATCPECAAPLVLQVGTPRPRFGWLVLSMGPGLFSGVAACFVAVPVTMWIRDGFAGDMPWPVAVADAFGFASAASVALMYRKRDRIMHWRTKKQIWFCASVWGVHVAMFGLLVLAMWLTQS